MAKLGALELRDLHDKPALFIGVRMKRLILAVAILLSSVAPSIAQVEIVAAVKNDLVARGVNLQGACGAFEITKRVAWVLRAQGAGLLSKPTGNNCQGYADGFITYVDGSGVDIIGDAGGQNIPTWQVSEPPGALLGRWRAPFDPLDSVTPPVTPPGPVTPPTAGLEQQILDELLRHESLEAIERAEAKEFRAAVGNKYRDAVVFVSKYILPAVGAIFIGREIGKD